MQSKFSHDFLGKNGSESSLMSQQNTVKLVETLKFHVFNKTPAKHRYIFLSFRLHHLSHSYFGRGIRSK